MPILTALVRSFLVAGLVVAGVATVQLDEPPRAVAACTISAPLSIGAQGTAVRCVQRALRDHGLDPGPIDGDFGPMTRRAVVAHQRSESLVADGVVGPATGRSLGIWRGTHGCRPARRVPADATKVVDVRSTGTWATLRLLKRTPEGQWRCKGRVTTARVGRRGTRALERRVGGDGTTPRGVFPLGSMKAPNGDRFQFFGTEPNPGVKGGWHRVRQNDCWWVDPGTKKYNRLISRARSACTGENEYLPDFGAAYSRAALIGANMGPDRVGDDPGETPRAAAIFLHRHSYDAAGTPVPTSGCVSLAGPELDFVLRRLPVGTTYFVVT